MESLRYKLRLLERLWLVKIRDGREPPLHRRIIARKKTNPIVQSSAERSDP
jgi:hypothetical protein